MFHGRAPVFALPSLDSRLVTVFMARGYACRAEWWCLYTGLFIMFSVITNIYNKKTKGPTLMELFTATGKMKKFFSFDN